MLKIFHTNQIGPPTSNKGSIAERSTSSRKCSTRPKILWGANRHPIQITKSDAKPTIRSLKNAVDLWELFTDGILPPDRKVGQLFSRNGTQGDRLFEFLQFRETGHAEVLRSICAEKRFDFLGQMLRSTSA
jgi:hypothetical protein